MTDLELAKQTLDMDRLAFALVRGGRIVARGTASGAVELLAALDRVGEAARGASLADKVVGKAVALMAVHAGIVAVDARLASQSAVDFCARHSVPIRTRTMVPVILNRRGDGPCPLEQLSLECTEPGSGVTRLRAFFAARAGALAERGRATNTRNV